MGEKLLVFYVAEILLEFEFLLFLWDLHAIQDQLIRIDRATNPNNLIIRQPTAHIHKDILRQVPSPPNLRHSLLQAKQIDSLILLLHRFRVRLQFEPAEEVELVLGCRVKKQAGVD